MSLFEPCLSCRDKQQASLDGVETPCLQKRERFRKWCNQEIKLVEPCCCSVFLVCFRLAARPIHHAELLLGAFRNADQPSRVVARPGREVRSHVSPSSRSETPRGATTNLLPTSSGTSIYTRAGNDPCLDDPGRTFLGANGGVSLFHVDTSRREGGSIWVMGYTRDVYTLCEAKEP